MVYIAYSLIVSLGLQLIAGMHILHTDTAIFSIFFKLFSNQVKKPYPANFFFKKIFSSPNWYTIYFLKENQTNAVVIKYNSDSA